MKTIKNRFQELRSEERGMEGGRLQIFLRLLLNDALDLISMLVLTPGSME